MKKEIFSQSTVYLCLGYRPSADGLRQQRRRRVKGRGTPLVYGSQDYTAINPALYEHGEINALLFAGLTAHDEDNKVVPALAESWKFDEESLTYTFKLREGADLPRWRGADFCRREIYAGGHLG